MGKFDSLLKTKNSKRKHSYNYINNYKKGHFSVSTDYSYFESLYVQDLWNLNKKKKYNKDLVTLWGKLDMRSYIDYELGNTYNPYFIKGSKHIRC